MNSAMEIVERARHWVQQDDRVLGAFVHGSAARGDVTPLSDVDLIVVARPGMRVEIWAEREQITDKLLGAEAVEAHEVPHQRPFRWQARAADLRMLDLALDEGEIMMWVGLAGEVQWLVDRGDLERQRQDWIAHFEPPTYDVVGADDKNWAILTWLAGALLHDRTLLVHRGITDVIGNLVVPVSDRPGYGLGSAAEDAALMGRIEEALPHSLQRAELARYRLDGAVVTIGARRTRCSGSTRHRKRRAQLAAASSNSFSTDRVIGLSSRSTDSRSANAA